MLTPPPHDRYDYSSLPERKDYSWPQGRRLAVCILTSIEGHANGKEQGWDHAREGGPHPQRVTARHDYGHRIGIWRFFDLLEQFKLPAAHNIDALLYTRYPQITDAIRKRGDEVVALGCTSAQGLGELDQIRLIDDVTKAISKHEGTPPRGWMGPADTERAVSSDLLKEAGYKYVMGWLADDQPFWLSTRAGPILSMPYPAELNDSTVIVHGQRTARDFADMIVDGFNEMLDQSRRHPLVMTISLHPFIMGQPFRLPALRKALSHCVQHPEHDKVWWTTPGAVADHCYDLPPGIIPGEGPVG